MKITLIQKVLLKAKTREQRVKSILTIIWAQARFNYSTFAIDGNIRPCNPSQSAESAKLMISYGN